MEANKTKLSTNNLVLLAVIGSLLVAVATFIIGKNLVAQFLFSTRVISKQLVAERQLKENIRAIPSLRSNYEQLGYKVQLIGDSLPSTPNFPSIVSMVEVIAGASGVRLKTVSPGVATAPIGTSSATPATGTSVTLPQAYPFSVSVEGSYDNLLRFYLNLELSSRPIKITSIHQAGSSSGQQVEVNLTTYYQDKADMTPKTEVVK